MNILHTVESYPPSIGGMQEVVRQISERLVKLGHTVTVATSKNYERESPNINGVNIVEFDISGNAVKGYKGNINTYREFLLTGSFDIITNFAAQQWATDIMLPLLDNIRSKKIFVPTGFSGLYWPQYREYFLEMAQVIKKYDMNVFLSDDYRDINFARDHGVVGSVLIPNGAGEDEFSRESKIDIRTKYGVSDNHFLIIHVGSHTGIKGHAEAIRIFLQAKIDNATLLLIANAPGGGCTRMCRFKEVLFNKWQKIAGNGKKLQVLSLSREETVSAYHHADLFLFPSNIECSPIVLFECMASKTPFLTTDVGNAKEIITWSGSGLLLPTRKTKTGFSRAFIGQSAKVLEGVWADQNLRDSMKDAGFAAWKERFTWEKIALAYESIYKKLVGEDDEISNFIQEVSKE